MGNAQHGPNKVVWAVVVLIAIAAVVIGWRSIAKPSSSGVKMRTYKIYPDTNEANVPGHYESRKVGIKLRAPAGDGWKMFSQPNSYLVLTHKTEKFVEILNREKLFFAEGFDAKVSSDEEARKLIAEWGRLEYRKGLNAPKTRVTLGGEPADRAEWTFVTPVDKDELRFVSYTVRKGDRVYYLIYYVPTRLYNQVKDEIDQMLGSVAFL